MSKKLKIHQFSFIAHIFLLCTITTQGVPSNLEDLTKTLLENENAVHRTFAAFQLRFHPSIKALRALTFAIRDPNEHTRNSVRRSLGFMPPGACIVLKDLLVGMHENINALNILIESVANQQEKCQSSALPLIKIFENTKTKLQTKIRILVAFSRLKNFKTLPTTLDALYDSQILIRTFACKALGEFNDPRAQRFLMHKYERDSSQSVRESAWLALNKRGVILPYPSQNTMPQISNQLTQHRNK